jgi:ABC-type Na+ efflux pump permease subunit
MDATRANANGNRWNHCWPRRRPAVRSSAARSRRPARWGNSLLLTLLAFKLSAQFASSAGQAIDVGFMAMGKMLLILLPMLFIGTSLLTYLSAAAKSMKEAQSHMMWLMLMPMIPTIMLMVNPLKEQSWQYTVPFLAQNQIAQGDPRRVH